MSSFGSLFLYSFLAVLEIILLCAAGSLMARLGIITPTVRTALSKMVFYVLLPAITFVKVTPAVTAALLAHWWPIVVNVVATVCGGLGLGALVALATRTPPHLRRHVIVATGLGNLNQLPLMLVTSVCADPKLLFAAALGPSCTDTGIAYVVVGMAIASIFHHAVSYHLLKPRPWLEPQPALPTSAPPAAPAGDGDKEPAADAQRSGSSGGGRRADSATDLNAAIAAVGKSARGRPALVRTVSVRSGADFTSVSMTSALQVEEAEAAPARSASQRLRTGLARAWRAVGYGAARFFDIVPVPTFVSLIGLAVGCIPPLKALLFGPAAPLKFATDALAILAQATVPAMSFTLGAVLEKGPGRAAIGWASVAGVIAARLALVPGAGGAMVIGGAKLGAYAPLNPMFVFVLLLQNSSPTAINIQAIATMHGNHEKEMAALLFWQYMAAVLLLPLLVAAYMALIPAFGLAGVTST